MALLSNNVFKYGSTYYTKGQSGLLPINTQTQAEAERLARASGQDPSSIPTLDESGVTSLLQTLVGEGRERYTAIRNETGVGGFSRIGEGGDISFDAFLKQFPEVSNITPRETRTSELASGNVPIAGTETSVSPPTRSSGESISDFTRRIDQPSEAERIAAMRQLNPNITNEEIQRILGAFPQSAPTTTSSGTKIGATKPIAPIVGTSSSERFSDFADQFGLGDKPEPIDIFTRADELRLNEARTERDKIDEELISIQDERFRLEDEFRKFSDEQVGLPEAGRLGALSEEGRALERQFAALNRRELVLETKLRNRNNVISELSGLQRQEYSDAVTDYNTRFSQALQLYSIFDAEQDEFKQNAAANLQVLADTYSAQIGAGQITQLSNRQKIQLEELEAQAGYPIGSTEARLSTLKPEETELAVKYNAETGVFQQLVQDAQGNLKVKVAQGQAEPGSGGGTTGGGEKPLSVNQIEQFRRSYGWTPPFGYSQEQLIQFMNDNPGLSPEEYEEAANQVESGQQNSQSTQQSKQTLQTPEQIVDGIMSQLSDSQLKAFKKLADEAGVSSFARGTKGDVEHYLNTITPQIQEALSEGYTIEEVIAFYAG